MKKIICLPGDGIGPEIIKSAVDVLEFVGKKYDFDYEIEYFPFGGSAIDEMGHPFPEELKTKISNCDAVLLGAVGGPKWDNEKVRPEQGLLQLRKHLEVFANVRPLSVNKSLSTHSPIKEEIISGTDLVIVRELTGGAYFGEPRRLLEESALDSVTYTKNEIEKIVRYAFELAKTRNNKLTSVDKANVLATSKLWRKIVIEISNEYPEVEVDHMYVDAMSMALITNPNKFDVIVTENLFGDILSDEASVLGGSLGVLASASFSLDGPNLYEPAHGSAPDIANKNIANPIATILSLAMMIRHSFGLDHIAKDIENCVDEMISDGLVTCDLKKENYLTTTEFTEKLIEKLGYEKR